MYFLDVIAGPTIGVIAMIFLLPILVAVTIALLVVRGSKKKDDKDNKDE